MARKKAAKAKAAPTNLRVKSLAADKARGVRGGGSEPPPLKISLKQVYITSYNLGGSHGEDKKD